MGKEGEYCSSVPRSEKSSHPSWAATTLCTLSLHTQHLWVIQIPLVGVGLYSRNWRHMRTAVGQEHDFWLSPQMVFLILLKSALFKTLSLSYAFLKHLFAMPHGMWALNSLTRDRTCIP